MTLRTLNNGGVSPLAGLKLAAKPAQTALYQYLTALAPTRKGWFWKAGQVQSDLNSYPAGTTDRLRGGLLSDEASVFFTRDIFGRKLIANYTTGAGHKRHALLAKEVRDNSGTVIFGRPCIQLGMSNDGAWLVYSTSGNMVPDSSTDEDAIDSGGWTAIWDILMIPNGNTISVTYGDDSILSWAVNNGAIPFAMMGSRAIKNSTGKAFSIYFDSPTTGSLLMRNNGGVNSWDGTTYAHNFVDGTRYLLMAGYDPGTSTMKLYKYVTGSGETLLATKTSVSVDIDPAPSGAKKARLYGIGDLTSGASIQCNGCFSSINGFFPDPTLLTNSVKRAALWAAAEEA